MRTSLLFIMLTVAATGVMAAQPTDQSVDTFLELTKAESMVDSALVNMENMVKQNLAQATQGKPLTDQQRRSLETAPGRIVSVLREHMNWATLKPMYIQIYKESFDQAEIDGLIDFYRSPIGQSFVSKTPIVMQKSMTIMQAQFQSLLPKVQEAMKQALEDANVPD